MASLPRCGLESGAVGKSLDEKWFWSLAQCGLCGSQWKLPGTLPWASRGLFPPLLSRDADPSPSSGGAAPSQDAGPTPRAAAYRALSCGPGRVT